MSSTLIIGAGITGLTAARYLTQQGWNVTVIDKGRGVGGRMATRRIEQARADHGAQYFSVQTPEFTEFITELVAKQIITEWSPLSNRPYYIGAEGMNAIAKEMARGLTVHTNERVVKVWVDDKQWVVETEAGTVYRADTLICTIPAPQALDLWRQSSLELTTDDYQALTSIVYEPCLAVLLTMSQPSRITEPGIRTFQNGDINWVVDNQQKGISPTPSVTIQASAIFSEAHLEGDLPSIGQRLANQLTEWIPVDTVTSLQVHRWRYSLAKKRYPSAFLRAQAPLPLLFGGDGFDEDGLDTQQQSIERAFTSGRKMAESLLRY